MHASPSVTGCLECRLHLRNTRRVSQEEKFETQVRMSGVDMEVDMLGDTLSQLASPWVAIKLLHVDLAHAGLAAKPQVQDQRRCMMPAME